jgi:hypothetical protein
VTVAPEGMGSRNTGHLVDGATPGSPDRSDLRASTESCRGVLAGDIGDYARPAVSHASGDQDSAIRTVQQVRIFMRDSWSPECPDLPRTGPSATGLGTVGPQDVRADGGDGRDGCRGGPSAAAIVLHHLCASHQAAAPAWLPSCREAMRLRGHPAHMRLGLSHPSGRSPAEHRARNDL